MSGSLHRTRDSLRTKRAGLSLRALMFILLGAALALAAAYGAFGPTLVPVGIVVSFPLLYVLIVCLMGGPWLALIWIVHLFSCLIPDDE